LFFPLVVFTENVIILFTFERSLLEDNCYTFVRSLLEDNCYTFVRSLLEDNCYTFVRSLTVMNILHM